MRGNGRDMNQYKQIVIVGAGGQGRVAADIAKRVGYEKVVFLDDAPVAGASGKIEIYRQYVDRWDFFVAIGDSLIRERIQGMLQKNGAEIVSLVHPSAVVADDVIIGAGTAVMAGAVINTGAVLGDGVIVNTCASVDHDCRIGDFVHVAVGAHVCGTVQIGERAWIGAGATVVNNLGICADCMIGAGAVVIKPITEAGTYLGIPGKKVK